MSWQSELQQPLPLTVPAHSSVKGASAASLVLCRTVMASNPDTMKRPRGSSWHWLVVKEDMGHMGHMGRNVGSHMKIR